MEIKPAIQEHLSGIRQHLDYLIKSPGERTSREIKDICDCIIYNAEEIKKELDPATGNKLAVPAKSLIRYSVCKWSDRPGNTELSIFENGLCCSLDLNADELAGLVKELTEEPGVTVALDVDYYSGEKDN